MSLPWYDILLYSDVDVMAIKLNFLFNIILDTHAPLQTKQITKTRLLGCLTLFEAHRNSGMPTDNLWLLHIDLSTNDSTTKLNNKSAIVKSTNISHLVINKSAINPF